MGQLEKESRKRSRKSKLQRAILLTLASGGRLVSRELIPAVLDTLFDLDISVSARKKDVVRTATSHLNKKGLITFRDGHYQMTKSGKKILDEWQMSNYKINRPKKWDGKWRIIIFDIPETKKKVRDEIRTVFKEAGFQRLQDSVWVYPYDCEDIIGLLKTDYGVGKHMLYIIADQIENDKYLRMDFDLIS